MNRIFNTKCDGCQIELSVWNPVNAEVNFVFGEGSTKVGQQGSYMLCSKCAEQLYYDMKYRFMNMRNLQ